MMDELLGIIHVPTDILHGDRLCSCTSHCHSIEQYFQSLLDVIILAESFLPKKTPRGKGGRDYWNDVLSDL